ncbi:Na+/H+ antiporter NhaC family protein, partial [Staphylococcus xylosus]|uniref:Na+/H+ antiporter NhaC family protein n=1 Tax=Staphylococcus xylosus TaxID=1288 RepID=UPI0030BEEAED
TIAIILSIINEPSLNIQKISNTIMNGYIANTGDQSLDNLLSRGGIMSMLGSSCLIILALALGGLLIKFEIVSTFINKIKD